MLLFHFYTLEMKFEGNIFMDNDYNIMLGDFGETRHYTSKPLESVFAAGTMLYMAPEVVNNEEFLF
jgi:serine/threonine protein kinase